ncbi:MAG: hypothetical protein K6G50_01850 [bacterium]|nr:hypothetical protein [bacterium]
MKKIFKISLRIFLRTVLLLTIFENYLCFFSDSDYSLVKDRIRFIDGKGSFAKLCSWKHLVSEASVSAENCYVIETCDDNGTRPAPYVLEPRSFEMLLGCSYSYGMGVSDHDTYLWRIGEAFPDVQFDNFSFPGYGTVECRVCLEQALQDSQRDGKHYDKIFYGLMLDHLNRNAGLRWNKKSDNYIVFPWSELVGDNVIYHEQSVIWWPGSDRFKTIIFIRNLYLNYLAYKSEPVIDWFHLLQAENDSSPVDERLQTKIDYRKRLFNAILADMLKMADNYGAELYVLYLERNADDLIDKDLKAKGLRTLDLSFPFDGKQEYWSMPACGGHPNALVHKAWAESFVRQMKDKF